METLRSNKTISVFQATGLKILGREGKHIFGYFFLEKIQSYAFFLSKCIKLYFFQKT